MKNLISVDSDLLPACLFKGYGEEDFARGFAEEGRIRLRTLQFFKKIEDESRRDRSEGETYIQTEEMIDIIHVDLKTKRGLGISTSPGVMHHKGSFGNLVYVFCMSKPEVEWKYFLDEMGPYSVEIFDTKLFIDELVKSALMKKPKDMKLLYVATYDVMYTKGEISSSFDLLDFKPHIAQKSHEFNRQCEFRVALVYDSGKSNEEAEEYLDLKLNRAVDYARLL